MLDKVYKGALNIGRLNCGIIILIPKTKYANNIGQYRPICALSVIF